MCMFWVVCVELWKRRTRATKKGGERRRGTATWGVTRRGESLAVQSLQTNNNSRGLLPSPWALDCSKGLLPSKRFFGLIKKRNCFYFFIYLFSICFLIVLLVFLISFFEHFTIFWFFFSFSLFLKFLK
jgi:hypothetical protein